MESEENWPRNETEETNHSKKSTGWGDGQKEEEKTEEREREREREREKKDE